MSEMRLFVEDYNNWLEVFDFFLKAKGIEYKTEEGAEFGCVCI